MKFRNLYELLQNVSLAEFLNGDIISEILGMLLTSIFLHYYRAGIIKSARKIFGPNYRLKCLLCFVIFVSSLAFIVYAIPARPTQREIEAQEKRMREDRLLEELMNLASTEDFVAQNKLGDMYYRGRDGVKQNYSEAFKWYSRSAAHEYKSAQYNLGIMYYEGHGVKQNYSEALRWFWKAAEKGGFPKAEYKLADMYFEGKGCTRNVNTALKLYESAASQKYYKAAEKLGDIYLQGLSVKKNYRKAVLWYTKAAEGDDPEMTYRMGNIYFEGKIVKRDYSAALQWYEKSVNRQYIPAMFSLAGIYYNGYGVKRNYSKAFFWYREVFNNGYGKLREKAMIIIGDMYYEGLGVEQNYQEALRWYKYASISTDREIKNEARFKVSRLEESLRPGSIMKKAEDNYNMGIDFFRQGRKEMAVNLLELAALHGHIEAQKRLGYIYANDPDIFHNYSKSYVYYYLAWLCSNNKDSDIMNTAHKTGRKLTKSEVDNARKEAEKIFSELKKFLSS